MRQNFRKTKQTRQVSSMIHSARPTVSPVANIIVFALICFVCEKWGRTDGRTDDMRKNNDHYRPWLWVGLVDQLQLRIVIVTGGTVGLPVGINDDHMSSSNISKLQLYTIFWISTNQRIFLAIVVIIACQILFAKSSIGQANFKCLNFLKPKSFLVSYWSGS